MNVAYERVLKRLLNEVVREKLDLELPDDLIAISREFKRSGHKLFVVGGAVRDALLSKKPKDYDLATDALPERVEEIISTMQGYRVLEIGKAFGVVKVLTPSKEEFEVATFRKDVGKGRRPDSVKFTDIEQDVLRRDLTINALFYDIDAHEVVDYVGGIDDIRHNRVRAVGDPSARFDEDRLRILRVVRFAARMGSDLDRATRQAIVSDNSLAGVSYERIRDELIKGIMSAKNVSSFLSLIDELGLWSQVMPGLNVNDDYVETRNVPVLLALVLRHNDPDLVAKRLNALKYTAAEAAQVSFLVKFQELTTTNAFRMYKSFLTSGLRRSDVEEFAAEANRPTSSLVAAFVKYAPSVKAVDIIANGYEGQALGREVERRETLLFADMVDSL